MLGAILGTPMRVEHSKRTKNLLSFVVVLILSYRTRLEKFIEFFKTFGDSLLDWFPCGYLCFSCWAAFYADVIGVVALLLLNNRKSLEATAASSQVGRALLRTT